MKFSPKLKGYIFNTMCIEKVYNKIKEYLWLLFTYPFNETKVMNGRVHQDKFIMSIGMVNEIQGYEKEFEFFRKFKKFFLLIGIN